MARIKLLWKFEFWDCISNSTEIEINTIIQFVFFFQFNNIIFDELKFLIFKDSENSKKIVINIAANASFFTMTYTKIFSGWGSAPDPTWVAYSASIAIMAGIKLLWKFELWGLHFKFYWN